MYRQLNLKHKVFIEITHSKFTASPEGLAETNNITNTVSPFLFQRTENQIKALTPKHFHWFQLNIKRSTVA